MTPEMLEAAPISVWAERSACRAAIAAGEASQDWWFPDYPANRWHIRDAKAICASCPVQPECLSHALVNREVGIWGGVVLGDRGRPGRVVQCSECELRYLVDLTHGGRIRLTCSAECAKRRSRRLKDEWNAARGIEVGKRRAEGHGLISRYQRGCRCNACRAVARDARREYRNRAAEAAFEDEDVA